MVCRPLPCLYWRGSAGEAIDSGALSFLLEQQLVPRFVEEEKEEPKVEQVPESAVWVQFRDKAGKTSFWNRRTHETVWKAPADVDVVWVATEGKRGGRLLLAQGNLCQNLGPSSSSSWVMGGGVRGLASPHPILGASAWKFSASPSVLAVSCSVSWC